jgi:hypothetical protein
MRTVHEHDGAKIIQLRNEPATHLIGDYISLTIYELSDPGRWILGCSAARIEDREFEAKPHDVDNALRVAVNLVSDRLVWLMQQWERELLVMKKAVETDMKVDQPTPPELGSRG